MINPATLAAFASAGKALTAGGNLKSSDMLSRSGDTAVGLGPITAGGAISISAGVPWWAVASVGGVAVLGLLLWSRKK